MTQLITIAFFLFIAAVVAYYLQVRRFLEDQISGALRTSLKINGSLLLDISRQNGRISNQRDEIEELTRAVQRRVFKLGWDPKRTPMKHTDIGPAPVVPCPPKKVVGLEGGRRSGKTAKANPGSRTKKGGPKK